MKKVSVKRICTIGVLTAIAMIFSYVESIVPISLPIPGVRLGLANLVVLLTMIMLGYADALCVGLVRLCLSALFFGNIFSFWLSLAGFIFSFCVMLVLVKINKFSVPGISLAGGACHNIGQLLCASFLMGSVGVLTYTIILVIVGMLTGTVNGIICKMIYERTKKYDWLS